MADMADNIKTNLNILQDMILDEEKLVTYVSLSKELCVHVNESKMLLHQVVQDIRRKQPDINLNINCIVSGITDKNIARIFVCTETELSDLKKCFRAIFFEHFYSVSKGYPRVDRPSLLATNKFEDLILCTGIIKSSMCVKRTADEIGTLKSNSQELFVLDDEKFVNRPQKKIKKECVNKVISEPKQNKFEATYNDTKVFKNIIEPEIKKIDVKYSETKPVKNLKTEVYSPKKDVNSKQNVNKLNTRQKGIAGFLSKSNDVTCKKDYMECNIKKSVGIETKVETKVEEMSVDEEVTIEQEIKETDRDVIDNQKEVKQMNKNVDIKGDMKTQKITKKNLKVDKKRKRVLHVSDSESDNETSDPFVTKEQVDLKNESEDEIPPTPTINTIKITSGIVNPKKRRKIVDKTYSDEDYIVTKKEEVYESCSENEEEPTSKENIQNVNKVIVKTSPKEKKNSVKNSKKKVSSPQTGKQSTLMNYFKKVNQ